MNFKDLLKEKGITRSQLAKDANLGVGTVSEIVSGVRKEIRFSTAVKLANVLEVDVQTINKCMEERTDGGTSRSC